jgi:hypothetical protein
LLGLARRLQVPSYHRRVDEIICQQLDPATTTRRGFGIGAERMGFASWISGERTTTSRAGSGSASSPSPPVVAAASPTATSIGSGFHRQLPE